MRFENAVAWITLEPNDRRPQSGGSRSDLQRAFYRAATSLLATITFLAAPHAQSAAKEPVSIEDAVTAVSIMDPESNGRDWRSFKFSPNGCHFLVVTRQAELKTNLNRFDMWLFDICSRRKSASQARAVRVDSKVIVTMRSASNQAAISQARWLNDKELAYLGQDERGDRRVYKLRVDTGEKRSFGVDGAPAVSYDIAGSCVVFQAVERNVPSADLDRGLTAAGRSIWELINLEGKMGREHFRSYRTYIQKQDQPARAIESQPYDLMVSSVGVWLAPDCKHVVSLRAVNTVQQHWEQYENYVSGDAARLRSTERPPRWITQWVIIDLLDGHARPIVDAPTGHGFTYAPFTARWSADSNRILISNTFLPLHRSLSGDELKARRTAPVVGIYELDRDSFAPVVTLPVAFLHPDRRFTTEIVANADLDEIQLGFASRRAQPSRERYVLEKSNRWVLAKKAMNAATESGSRAAFRPRIVESQTELADVALEDPKTGERHRLTNFNSWLYDRWQSAVSTLEWLDRDGRLWRGGLLYPKGFVQGVRYPLVIQTHGFVLDKPLINGPPYYDAPFAAQTLAGHGMFVLQVEDHPLVKLDSEEGPSYLGAYEAVINRLTQDGLVDPQRVGIIGFSRTSFHVQYALAHHPSLFAAAIAADGMDLGYNLYVQALDDDGNVLRRMIERTNGGKPFWSDADAWMRRAPAFRADEVVTPLRLQAHGWRMAMVMWEFYAALRLLGKPVEMIYYAHGDHLLQRPQERHSSQSGTVDWLRFWLQGYEDSDSRKVEQYKGWRRMQEPNRARGAEQ